MTTYARHDLTWRQVYDWRHPVPGAGVYVLCDGAGEAVYVGRSKNPRQRLKAHRAGKRTELRAHLRVNEPGSLDWAIIIIKITDGMAWAYPEEQMVEAYLLDALSPRFNRRPSRAKPEKYVLRDCQDLLDGIVEQVKAGT